MQNNLNLYKKYNIRNFIWVYILNLSISYKILLLFYDLISVISTPFILIFYLPDNSIEIVEFIKMNTLDVKNVGNVCRYAYFEDFNKNLCLDKKIKDSSITLFEENHEIDKKYDSDESDTFEYEPEIKNWFF